MQPEKGKRGQLVKVTSYLFEDEAEALEARVAQDRTSAAEVIRRALRAYLRVGGEGGS